MKAIAALVGTLVVMAMAATTCADAALPNFGGGPMTAIFAQPSYAPGTTASLRITTNATRITVEPLSSLPYHGERDDWAPFTTIGGDSRVGPSETLAWHPGAGTVAIQVRDWPSGVYFVKVTSAQGSVVAPLIVRPRRLGTAHVLVVMPTYSWEAYDGRNGDTWYDCACVHTVDLSRPYLYGGVPYNFGQYDRALLTWLTENDASVDVISDQDYNAIASGADLRHAYRMIVFDGHSEYATSHMFDITEQYRDAGGHLAFLSANDFFREVTVSGNEMTLVGPFRGFGRPEASLLGAQYLTWDQNKYPNRPYIVSGATRVPWLFAGTGLHDGDLIQGNFGIEIDGVGPASPPQTIVLATIPDIFGTDTADMTYYSTRAGAEVFDAGTIDFGGGAYLPQVAGMLANLWKHMTGAPVDVAAPCPPS